MTDRRARKRNFTHEEIIILITKYKQHQAILESKFNNFVTNKKKQEIWDDITNAINAKGVEHRDVKEVRKKWSDLKMQAVEDFPRHVPTGGGPKPDMGPYSTLVLDIIGEDSPSVVGLSDGIESESPQEPPAARATPSPPTPASPPKAASPTFISPAEEPVPSPASHQHPEPSCRAGKRPKPRIQEEACSPPVPPPAKRPKEHMPPAPIMSEDLHKLRCQLFNAEIEKLNHETQKIKAEKEKIELEKVKLNLEIFKLEEDLKAQGYTVTLTTALTP